MKKTQPSSKKKLTLLWEIGLVLIVKFMLLWLLWYFFFSAPTAKHMQLPPAQVSQHLLSDPTIESPQHDR